MCRPLKPRGKKGTFLFFYGYFFYCPFLCLAESVVKPLDNLPILPFPRGSRGQIVFSIWKSFSFPPDRMEKEDFFFQRQLGKNREKRWRETKLTDNTSVDISNLNRASRVFISSSCPVCTYLLFSDSKVRVCWDKLCQISQGAFCSVSKRNT